MINVRCSVWTHRVMETLAVRLLIKFKGKEKTVAYISFQ